MPSYYLGIDVSKGYADFAILDSHKHPVEASFQFELLGFDALKTVGIRSGQVLREFMVGSKTNLASR